MIIMIKRSHLNRHFLTEFYQDLLQSFFCRLWWREIENERSLTVCKSFHVACRSPLSQEKMRISSTATHTFINHQLAQTWIYNSNDYGDFKCNIFYATRVLWKVSSKEIKQEDPFNSLARNQPVQCEVVTKEDLINHNGFLQHNAIHKLIWEKLIEIFKR